jgi:hypothetical protein
VILKIRNHVGKSTDQFTGRIGSIHKYKGFISYSHAADDRLAPALQSGLQRFAKPWYRLRAMRVFRDKTGLSVTPELWGSIQKALADADYFILLASPQAAQFQSFKQEVDWLAVEAASVYPTPEAESALLRSLLEELEAMTGARVVQLIGHTGPGLSAGFSPNGRRMVTVGLDGQVKLYFLQDHSVKNERDLRH